MSSACKELNIALDDILCSGVKPSSEQYVGPVKQELVPTAFLPRLSGPLTVIGVGNEPVIVEDPVRFRKDIQSMVMAQMLNGLPSDEQIDEIEATGSMIEIATVNQMVKAARGDLDSFKYMMDRVLGKPVNQTNTVSMTVSYEQMLDELNPDEVIEPKKVFCEEI
tara:strand:+ start:53 stop:547 length:495 start_codon:yes stop_codon:yes gene_type:complete